MYISTAICLIPATATNLDSQLKFQELELFQLCWTSNGKWILLPEVWSNEQIIGILTGKRTRRKIYFNGGYGVFFILCQIVGWVCMKFKNLWLKYLTDKLKVEFIWNTQEWKINFSHDRKMKVELVGPIWGRQDQNPPGAHTGWTETGWSQRSSSIARWKAESENNVMVSVGRSGGLFPRKERAITRGSFFPRIN